MQELQLRMSSAEFAEWAAFYNLEPWGWEAGNWHAGVVASAIANTVRDPKKRRKPFMPDDFMPTEAAAKPRGKSVDQGALRAKLDAAMAAFGGQKKVGAN